jgi:hypothetical protein
MLLVHIYVMLVHIVLNLKSLIISIGISSIVSHLMTASVILSYSDISILFMCSYMYSL